MAEGIDHRAATKRNLKLLAVPSLFAVAYDPLALGFPLGLALGHVLTPDIDHPWKTIEELKMYSYNPWLGRLWYAFWWPYQKTHSHRGISHRPFVGTAERFFYLLWLPWLLTAGLGWQVHVFWLFLYIGWCWQDFTHLRLDRRKPHGKKKVTRRIPAHNRSRKYKNRRIYKMEPSNVFLRSHRMYAHLTGGNKGNARS